HTRFSRDWSSDVCSSDLSERFRSLIFRSPEPPPTGVAPACGARRPFRGASTHVEAAAVERGAFFAPGAPADRTIAFPSAPIARRSEERRVGKRGGAAERH